MMEIDETNEVMMNHYKKQELIKAKKRLEEKMSKAEILRLANKRFITEDEIKEALGFDYIEDPKPPIKEQEHIVDEVDYVIEDEEAYEPTKKETKIEAILIEDSRLEDYPNQPFKLYDEDEVKMIEELNPDIVLTDLMRNHKYTGLEIIKEYKEKNKDVAFLVISADSKEDVINNGLDVEGYIKKPISDYEIVYEELKRIKKELEHKKYLQWDEKYHNEPIVNLKNMLTLKERNLLKKLGIFIKNKKYTAYEIECLELNLLVYYDDPEDDLTAEERKGQKLLHGTGVGRDDYNQILAKVEKIKEELIFVFEN